MVYKCLSQRPDDFIDEFNDNGFVNLEEAINFFRTYPFVEELKLVRSNELTERFSIIKFQNNSNCMLSIWKENLDGTFLCYENENQFAQFFISNNFLENKDGLNTDYFIKLFFLETIENEITLKKKIKSNDIRKQPIAFSFNDDTKKIRNLYASLPWFVFSMLFLILGYKHMSDLIFLHVILSLFWLPSCYLYLSYMRVNKNAKVKIDYSQKSLSYEKDGKRIKFNRSEIDKCFIYEVSASSRLNTKSFSYLHIVLFDRRRIVITNFIADPRNVVNYLDLNYKVDEVMIPFLPF